MYSSGDSMHIYLVLPAFTGTRPIKDSEKSQKLSARVSTKYTKKKTVKQQVVVSSYIDIPQHFKLLNVLTSF
jgi:hypothetical protein